MSDGFKLFQALPSGSGSALSKAAKSQQVAARTERTEAKKVRAKGPTMSLEDVVAAQVADEIKVRLKTDRRFQKSFYGSKQTAAGAVEAIKQDVQARLKATGQVDHNGVRIIKGSLPSAWKSNEEVL